MASSVKKNAGTHLIDRRTVLKTGGAAIASLTLGGFSWAENLKNKPNIVFIMADDLGYADLGCYGRDDISTPAIDSLAADGMKFFHGYSNSSICSPTRVGLFTGRYQYRQRAGLDEPIHKNKYVGLPVGQPTLANQLKLQGYNTALIGKWHMGTLDHFSPLHHGYDKFWGIRGGGVDYYTHKLVIGEEEIADLWDGDTKIEEQGYLTELIGDHASEQIGAMSNSSSPFMISVHFTAPHWPWETIEDPEAAAKVRSSSHQDGGSMAIYRSMVENLDANVGKILNAIDAAGQTDNTIVVFTSDNGGERFSKTWPFNGMKGELLEGGIRTPLLVRWPSMIKPGTTTNQVAISMDWLPTFVSLAGGSAPATDGINLGPTLLGAPEQERVLFWRFLAQKQAAMRKGRFKYLRLAGREYLFDIIEDPQERGNLKIHYPEIFKQMKLAWEEWNATMKPYPADATSADLKLFGTVPERY